MPRFRQLVLLVATLATPSRCKLSLTVYETTALTGPISSERSLDTDNNGVSFSIPGGSPFSAEARGTMTLVDVDDHQFTCDFGSADLGFLFVDDHLVCQMGAYSVPPAVTGVDNPLKKLSKSQVPLRLEVYYAAADTCHGVKSVGCFDDGISGQAHQCGFHANGQSDVNSWSVAANACHRAGYKYAAAEDGLGKEIWCGDTVPSCPRLDDAHCATPCPGNSSEVCGGAWGLEVFEYDCNVQPSKHNVSIAVSWKTTSGAAITVTEEVGLAEQTRRKLQRGLSKGWGPWLHNSVLQQVHLPSGAVASIALCQISNGVIRACQETARPDDGATRVGPLAYDRSYGQFFLSWSGANVSFTFSAGDELQMLFALEGGDSPSDAPDGYSRMEKTDVHCDVDASPCEIKPKYKATVQQCADDCDTTSGCVSFGYFNGDCYLKGQTQLLTSGYGDAYFRGKAPSEFAVVVSGRSAWKRAVSVTQGDNSLLYAPFGLDGFALYTTEDVALASGGPHPQLVLPLYMGRSSGISTGNRMSVEDISANLELQRQREERRYISFGHLAAAKAAAQAGVMWNYIYNPIEAGPLAPVSRGWDFTRGAQSTDWSYVIFDWDNIFASYLLSLDAKDLAYSNLIQVIKSKTAGGFVPGGAAAHWKSVDRTEPPIGAKVVLEIYRKYRDQWLVELLFDDLLDWNNWFVRERLLQPAGLVALGSDCNDWYRQDSACSMQGARYESGLDNSPMYDGDFFDNKTQMMQLYDVGMSSMFAMEAEALAELAAAIGRPECDDLRQRARAMRELMVSELWDENLSIFANKRPNGSFSRRISPTSFYPLLTGGPSESQATEMMEKWMMDPKRFCITPNGDFAGNSDDCFWGLPSISADDSAFPQLGYWRGYVWGPMMQLTYWGLQRYDHVPSVRTARKALCKQMTALMLSQWHRHGHICENFGPHRDTGDCTGNSFYHWGALGGFISLIEEGHYNTSGHNSESSVVFV